jgi:hypothetical protein
LDPAAGRQRMGASAPRAPRCACLVRTPAFAARRYTREHASEQTTSKQQNRTDSRSRPAASSVGTMTSQSCARNAAVQPRMPEHQPTGETRLLQPLRECVLEVRQLRHARPRLLSGRPQRAEYLEELVNLRVAREQRPVVDHLHEDAADGPEQATPRQRQRAHVCCPHAIRTTGPPVCCNVWRLLRPSTQRVSG